MKIIVFSVCLLLFLSYPTMPFGKKGENQEKVTQLKVAAYNVEYSKKGTPIEIGEALKPFDFDIVAFSEAPGGTWTQEVANVLGMDYVVVGRYSTAGHQDKYKTIASRTPLYGYEEVLMADTLHTATKALTNIGGREIAIYSVHFPFGWRDQAHIDETTGKVTSFVNYLKEQQSDETIPVIMGDFNFILFNASHKSPYYEMFVDMGFEASWLDLGIDVTQLGTMTKFKPEKDSNGGVIDHILHDPEKTKVLDGQIIEMKKPLSDHKPVWALLQLKANP